MDCLTHERFIAIFPTVITYNNNLSCIADHYTHTTRQGMHTYETARGDIRLHEVHRWCISTSVQGL